MIVDCLLMMSKLMSTTLTNFNQILVTSIWFFSSTSMICINVKPKLICNGSDSLTTGLSSVLYVSNRSCNKRFSLIPAKQTKRQWKNWRFKFGNNWRLNGGCTYTSVNKNQKSNISTGSVVSNSIFYMYLHMVWMMLVFLAGIWIYVFPQNRHIVPETKCKQKQEIDVSFIEGNFNLFIHSVRTQNDPKNVHSFQNYLLLMMVIQLWLVDVATSLMSVQWLRNVSDGSSIRWFYCYCFCNNCRWFFIQHYLIRARFFRLYRKWNCLDCCSFRLIAKLFFTF